jgi:hypothetical protein
MIYVDVNLHSDFGAFNSMHSILYMHCDLYTEGSKPRNTPLQQTVYLRRSRVSILRVQNLYQCTDLGRVQGVKAGPTIIMHIQS